jgi:3-isopropylmalate/(R)-2-methylmalate dehydratase small subunit
VTKLEPFRRLEAVAMPLPRANVDTDQIVPARYLQKLRSANFGEFLFKDLRADPDFVLNQYESRRPRIIVADRNFGCGSSREHAVWALVDHGFRAAIAPSFGDIFHGNALKNGFLPVVLAEDAVKQIQRDAAAGTPVVIDLENQTAAGFHFDIAPFAKHCLLEGLDELAYTLGHLPDIEAFERNYEP